jgi:hypothetical protein
MEEKVFHLGNVGSDRPVYGADLPFLICRKTGDYCRRESQMEMHFGYRGFGTTARILLTAVAAILVSAPVSVGQSEDTGSPTRKMAVATCTDALKADYGAITLSRISHRHRSGVNRSVYATARLASGEAPRFRCIVRRGTRIVRVQVFTDGSLSIANSNSGWISADPYRVQSEPDVPAPVETPPEDVPKESEVPLETGPQFTAPSAATGFKTPGAATGFKTPGAATGFKTPGAQNESLFKPAK